MDVKELRVGTTCYFIEPNDDDVTDCYISTIEKDDLLSHLENGLPVFQPIPLTEEILLKKCNAIFENGFYKLGRLTIDFNRDEHGVFKHSVFIKDSLIDDFNYLHELQNIYYFTHRKTEMPINL